MRAIEELPISKKQEALLAELGIEDRAPRTLTYTVSKDPEHLMPKINIPIKDETTLTYKQTFLGRIHESGGMVDIAKLDSQAIRNQLGIHWAGQHDGQPEGVEWQDRIQGQK